MRKVAIDRFNLSLGGGLGPLMGKVFRIGHLGDLNEPMLLGCLATTELAMKTAGVPFAAGRRRRGDQVAGELAATIDRWGRSHSSGFLRCGGAS